MAGDDGLDLLGMHLLAADIDHAAAPPGEVEPSRAFRDHVAGVNKAIAAGRIAAHGLRARAGGRIVGVLLLIASEAVDDVRRCNVSRWYVEPEYRVYGTLLVRRALRHRDVTYINVSPAPAAAA